MNSIWDIIINWMIFLGECTLILIGVIFVYLLYRWTRAYTKRLTAIHKLKTTAKKCGFSCEKINNSHLNIGKRNMRTAFVLTRGLIQYNIHFHATVGKNRTIRFISPNAYISEKEFGYTLVLSKRAADAIMISKLFKPKDMSDDLLQISHSEQVAFPSNTIYTKGTGILHEGYTQDIVIFNPVPLKAFYFDGRNWVQIIGGENWNNLHFHDISSFCCMLERKYN